MKHLDVPTYRLLEGFQAHDPLTLRPVPPGDETGAAVIAHSARIDGTGGFAGHEFHGEPNPHVSRPNCAPAYYLGRPASLWINAMKPHRRRTATAHLA